MQISWPASTHSVWMLPVFNISLIGRVDVLGLNSVNWPLDWLQKLTHVPLAIAILLVNLYYDGSNQTIVYDKNYSNNIVTECINVYRATQSILHRARSLLSCGVRLFVTLMYRNGQFYYQTFSSPSGPIILVFQKGTRLWISDGSPSTGAPNRGGVYQKFAIFNQYFRNTNTDTEYRYRPSSTPYTWNMGYTLSFLSPQTRYNIMYSRYWNSAE